MHTRLTNIVKLSQNIQLSFIIHKHIMRKEIAYMDSSLKVLMFPWLAHGHLSPFLELAKALTQRNFIVYVCSTSANLAPFKKSLSEGGYTESITLVELRLQATPEFPPEYHTTKNNPPHLMHNLKTSLDKSGPEFSSILEKYKPDFLIYDFLQPWAPAIASKFNIPSIPFLTSSAAMSSLKLFYYYNHELEYPFSNIYLHGCEDPKMTQMVTCRTGGDYEGTKDRFVESIEQSSGLVLVKSSREIEGKYIDLLSSVIKEKKVALVGPLVQRPTSDDDDEIISWLDNKSVESTVFVSFGSEYFLTHEEIKEVAYGLDGSGVNFIWVVRCPVGEKDRVYEALPKEFFDKIEGKGLIVPGWAPQAKILNHKNIGGFITHCGWGSVLEGLSYTVPIIAAPIHLDQPINARLVEEVGFGVQAMRKNGNLDRENICEAIKEVFEGKKKGIVKARAVELSEKIKAQDRDLLDDFAEELKKLRKETNF